MIQKTIHEHKFYWEVWLEAAESYIALKESLKKRGYRNIPLPTTPLHSMKIKSHVYKKKPEQFGPEIETSPQKKMIRRKSRG